MALTVLRTSKADEKLVDVLGEFWDSELAQKFADLMKSEDKDDEYDFHIETPEVHPAQEKIA